MSSVLNLAPLPASVARHLSASALGKRVRAHADALHRTRSPEGSFAPAEPTEKLPLRLAQSDAAEALACFLDTTPTTDVEWLNQMHAAIVLVFAGDDQRTSAAIAGLDTMRNALSKAAAEPITRAVFVFDELLYGLCLTNSTGGPKQG